MTDVMPEGVVRVVDRPLPGGDGRRRVTVSWRADGVVPREAEVEVRVPMAAPLAEKVRWYLEDYAEFQAPPGPAIAAEAEHDLAGLGRDLFVAVFGAGDAATLWAHATRDGRGGLRVEVDTDPADVPGLPWELLREPGTDQPLVLAAGQFVRTHRQAGTTMRVPQAVTTLRVLLVICRPGGDADVPFRSVASRLVRSGIDRLPGLVVDVLRPPTYAHLARTLRQAREVDRPYQVVHFDGHGVYLDATLLPRHDGLLRPGDQDGVGSTTADATDVTDAGGSGGEVAVSPLRYAVSLAAPARAGQHGYLLFEDPATTSNQQLVDGPTLGALLTGAGVPVLVLNACRSAYAEAPAPPDAGGRSRDAGGRSRDADPGRDESGTDNPGTESDTRNVHDRIRAYGSLAAEVADAGVPGVVAMRYNVYVVTAAQFIADLYAHLLAGRTLGRAATLARQALADNPTREIGPDPVSLQDWVVPTIYEAVPLTLHTPARPAQPGTIRISIPNAAPAAAGASGLPRPPEVGFFGRDETLLALDRAFDAHRVVVLHALAGAGKTSTAAEFARWYVETGGLAGPNGGRGEVLWTSLAQHTPLEQVLDAAGTTFADVLEASGRPWQTLTDPATRREVVLQVLEQVPALWIWDNVEPVAGFPDGTESVWTDTEQAELKEFLRDVAARTQAKVLLTSRRREDHWLGDLPGRVQSPPMSMRERLQLATAIAARSDHVVDRGLDWRILLRFTGGNPLTITAAVRQALHDNATASTRTLQEFVDRVRSGQSDLEDEQNAKFGRDRSLNASLSYGFALAFTDAERAVLALLHLFRDVVDVDALCAMGASGIVGDDAVPALVGMTREAGVELLDRAVGVGLLTAYGNGHYAIHPALPWYFTTHYRTHHGVPGTPGAQASERAYVRVVGALGHYLFERAESGDLQVLATLRLEESNLLHAVRLGRTRQLRIAELQALQGLYQLYRHTGRHSEWSRLVDLILPDYLDLATEQPLPGMGDAYGVITGYRVHVARHRHDLATAKRLQIARIAREREAAEPYLNTPPAELTSHARNRIRDLAVAEQDLGVFLILQSDPDCLAHFLAAYELTDRIGDTPLQTIAATSVASSYHSDGPLPNLSKAKEWFHRARDLVPANDRVTRARIHTDLADIELAQLVQAHAILSAEEINARMTAVLTGHQRALDLLPPDHEIRAGVHDRLGLIYLMCNDIAEAKRHYHHAIQHEEAQGNAHGAARRRMTTAIALKQAGLPADALHYAQAAHDVYLALGSSALPAAENVLEFIRELEGTDDA